MLSQIFALFTASFALGFVQVVCANTYRVQDTYIGDSFYNGFTALAIKDPTQGRVNYVDTSTARNLNLTFASSDTFILRADHTSVLNPNGPGRNSVRLSSNNKYTTSVLVADIRHMPQGCGTWPALWTVGRPWPGLGEIDIVEGVNGHGPNQVTLHTSSGCTQPARRAQTGSTGSTDCEGTQGCGVRSNLANSFGPAFNANGGGWYAMERTSSSISVWFWPRRSNPPRGVSSGTSTIDTSTWGTPMAHFVNSSCDIASKFGEHNIVINLTLCGKWAGSAYSSAGCPGTCVDYVNKNPSAFTNAYFDFASLRVFV